MAERMVNEAERRQSASSGPGQAAGGGEGRRILGLGLLGDIGYNANSGSCSGDDSGAKGNESPTDEGTDASEDNAGDVEIEGRFVAKAVESSWMIELMVDEKLFNLSTKIPEFDKLCKTIDQKVRQRKPTASENKADRLLFGNKWRCDKASKASGTTISGIRRKLAKMKTGVKYGGAPMIAEKGPSGKL